MIDEEIRGAIGRGWCHPENLHKIMDCDLAEAITQEIIKLFLNDKNPYLGCATTKELIDELQARAGVSLTINETWPLYKTIDRH